MAKPTKPARMGRYTNLVNSKPTPRKRTAKGKGRFMWFRRLSRRNKLLVILAPILAFLIITPIVTYLMLQNDIKNPERLMNRNNTGIVLEDVNGQPFYSVGRAEHRNQVPLDQISDDMKHALLASEDKDFYKHGGVNFFSMIRAAVTGYGGGSTLTQQLVKNTLLSDERSYLRKYQEAFMAFAIEQNYSKDQILAMYLNSVYFGENAFGVEDAAQAYFNKAPKDLDTAESAMLIGLLPAPSAYSPISGNKTYAKERQTTVLSRMVTNGYITPEQKTAALNEELVYGAGAAEANSYAPHFVEMVINQLSQKYGYEKVMRSGFQVRTTLDKSVQDALQQSVNNGMAHVNAMGGSNASGIVIDPTTGEIRGLVGSADYNNETWGKVNMVTTARQPGSSFKPIYYAYALADGVVTPATILDDKVMDFGGGYIPRDADRNETSRGKASVRQALDWSLNIPSIHVMEDYGINKTIEAANSLGIDEVKKDGDYGLALALGSVEVPLETMVHAYAAFAGQGQQFDLQQVQQINDKFGKQIYTVQHAAKQVISKEGAFLLSNILSDNATRARIFGSSLTVNGHTVAVKTGTTNDSRDAWTIGYNPEYVVGVWVGNNDNAAMASGGSDMAGPIWRNTFSQILAGKPDVKFPVPDNIVQKNVCRNNGGLAAKSGANTYMEYFIAGALPTNSCDVEPTMISVCETATGKVISIDEEKFDATTQSKDTDNCKAPTEQVCNLKNGKIETINTSDFDASKYSRDTANCQGEDTGNGNGNGNGNATGNNRPVQACDTTTGLVVTIPRSQLDGVRYTNAVDNCQKATPSGRTTP